VALVHKKVELQAGKANAINKPKMYFKFSRPHRFVRFGQDIINRRSCSFPAALRCRRRRP
jgi:hypothetical protein